MSERLFQKILDAGAPAGEVIAVQSFFVTIRGLDEVAIHSLVRFSDGTNGYVNQVNETTTTVLHLGTTPPCIGDPVVLEKTELTTFVGGDFLGRVIDPLSLPRDGGNAIKAAGEWPVFHDAPPLMSRQMLTDQLESGVTMVDTLLPVVLGQRIAVLGDGKSGKSSFLTQVAINQAKQGRNTVFALVAKRRSDVDDLLSALKKAEVMDSCIVVVSTLFDSLVMSYLAPYAACAMAEYFWQHEGKDTIVVYDDLTAHAQVHREISLLGNVSPGRDSYPGDTFYAHSSLLERAGRLSKNGATLTSLPVVLTHGGDSTAYLPTNIMSITDGQLIFDLNLFREGVRPAINTGMSVSRVGGRGQNARQKAQASDIKKHLSRYAQAEEFSHFGSELAIEAQTDLKIGKRLRDVMRQGVGETHSILAQQLMLQVVLTTDPNASLDVVKLKALCDTKASELNSGDELEQAVKEIATGSLIELKGAE